MITRSSEAAAQWWADKLVGPTYYDNGDRTETGILGLGLMAMAAKDVDRVSVTDEQLDAFRSAVVRRVEDETAYYNPARGFHLGTDYGPDCLLREAAEEAGIDPRRFPWKTNSWVYRDHFVVSDGYQGRHTLVWAFPWYEPPPCNTQAFDETTHEPTPGKCGLRSYHDGDHGDWQPSPLCALCEHPTPEQWHWSNHHDFTPADD